MAGTYIAYSEFHNFIISQIDRIQRLGLACNETVTIFFVQARNESDIAGLKLIGDQLRTSDLIFQKDKDFIFVLQETDSTGRMHINGMIKEFFEVEDLVVASASYPEDGKDLKHVLEIIEEMIVDNFNTEVKFDIPQ
jgi:hypothetical protein